MCDAKEVTLRIDCPKEKLMRKVLIALLTLLIVDSFVFAADPIESSVNLINTLDKRISALEAAGGDATQFEQLKIQVQNLNAKYNL